MIAAAPNRAPARVLLAALLGLLAIRLAAYALSMPFNYDEISQAHATWLVSEKKKPYLDFHHDHAPFFWYVFAPAMKLLPQSFASIAKLRLINALFALGAFGLLGVLLLREAEGTEEKVLSAAALAACAAFFPVLQTLAEFRDDGLALLLALASVFAMSRSAAPRAWFAAGLLWAASAAVSPKLVLLPAAMTAASVLRKTADRRALLALAAGGTAGGLAALALAAALGVSPSDLYDFCVDYHRAFSRAFGARWGLFRSLDGLAREDAALVIALLAGAGGAVWAFRRRRFGAATAALTLFALLQPLWVHYPWRQYTVPVLLALAAPLALAFRGLLTLSRPGAALAAAGLFLFAWHGEMTRGAEIFRNRYLNKHVELGDRLLEWTPPGEPVAAQPPFHPVFRPDSTYFWIYSTNPGGPGFEEVAGSLPRLAGRFTAEAYARELAARPPALVVLPGDFAGPAYKAALAEFLLSRAAQYENRRIGPIEAFLRRPESPAP